MGVLKHIKYLNTQPVFYNIDMVLKSLSPFYTSIVCHTHIYVCAYVYVCNMYVHGVCVCVEYVCVGVWVWVVIVFEDENKPTIIHVYL